MNFSGDRGRVGKGISAQASHRTVRDSLLSYGSCHTHELIRRTTSDRTGLDSLFSTFLSTDMPY
jgi:hypothetical protein